MPCRAFFPHPFESRIQAERFERDQQQARRKLQILPADIGHRDHSRLLRDLLLQAAPGTVGAKKDCTGPLQ